MTFKLSTRAPTSTDDRERGSWGGLVSNSLVESTGVDQLHETDDGEGREEGLYSEASETDQDTAEDEHDELDEDDSLASNRAHAYTPEARRQVRVTPSRFHSSSRSEVPVAASTTSPGSRATLSSFTSSPASSFPRRTSLTSYQVTDSTTASVVRSPPLGEGSMAIRFVSSLLCMRRFSTSPLLFQFPN